MWRGTDPDLNDLVDVTTILNAALRSRPATAVKAKPFLRAASAF
jgi:hypothetical protein